MRAWSEIVISCAFAAVAVSAPSPKVTTPKVCNGIDGTKPTAHGKFSADPMTTWLTEKIPDRTMCTLNDFTFVDKGGKPWKTPASYPIDGASIPRVLWTLVGSPYTGAGLDRPRQGL